MEYITFNVPEAKDELISLTSEIDAQSNGMLIKIPKQNHLRLKLDGCPL